MLVSSSGSSHHFHTALGSIISFVGTMIGSWSISVPFGDCLSSIYTYCLQPIYYYYYVVLVFNFFTKEKKLDEKSTPPSHGFFTLIRRAKARFEFGRIRMDGEIILLRRFSPFFF
jgi:hypothetical protein